MAVYLSILAIRHHVLTRICLYAEVGTCSSFTPNSITNYAWNFEYNVHNIYVDGNTNSIFYATLVVVLYNSIHIPAQMSYVPNAILVMHAIHTILQRECCKSNLNEFSILCVETQVLWTEIFFLTYTKNIKIQFATQKMLLKVWIIN